MGLPWGEGACMRHTCIGYIYMYMEAYNLSALNKHLIFINIVTSCIRLDTNPTTTIIKQ